MLPNWYGISDIGFEYRGSIDDPLIHYKGRTFIHVDGING